MDARLLEISKNGDVATLHQLLQEEPLVLDTVTVPVALDTPLHIASLLGHTDLASEILRLKPEVSRVRDGRGFYPLHLASAKGHGGIVKKILEVDASLRLCLDKDGRIPLHLAAANNHVALLKELLPADHSFSQALTDKGETILHLSVKYNQFEAAKFIVEDFKELINMKDESGNTALHLATARRHGKMLKLLLQESTTEVNALNECGCTALDLLLQCPSDIGDMEVCDLLLSSGSKKGRQVCSSPQKIASPPNKRWTWKKSMLRIGLNNLCKNDDTWFKDKHNTLMIVSTVIAGATFQTGLNPPKPPGESNNIEDSNIYSPNHPGDTTNVDFRNIYSPGSNQSFAIFDAIALGASMLIILSLVGGLPLKNRLMTSVLAITLSVAVSSMGLAFLAGAYVLSGDDKSVFKVLASVVQIFWLLAVAIMICYHVVVMLIKFMRCVPKVLQFMPWWRR